MRHSAVKGHPYNFKRLEGAEPFRAATTDGMTILPEVDPRGDRFMPAVFDQGQLGSCTANAVEACFQRACGQHINRKARRRSRLDIYLGERLIEGQPADQDTGAYGHDGFTFLQQTGALLEADWPYDISTFAGPAPAGHRLKLPATLPVRAVAQDEVQIRQVLSNGQMVAFGFTVYDSFEAPATLQSGVVPMPGRFEQELGGHEVVAVGYLAAYPDHVLVRNSWGADVYQGLAGADVHGGGYFLFPWQYLLDPSLASDLRTIVV